MYAMEKKIDGSYLKKRVVMFTGRRLPSSRINHDRVAKDCQILGN
jgi:hypothetical protein